MSENHLGESFITRKGWLMDKVKIIEKGIVVKVGEIIDVGAKQGVISFRLQPNTTITIPYYLVESLIHCIDQLDIRVKGEPLD
ncbi:MAG: hypothetical protein PHP38_02285 [Sphaerochaetaceae bacterium]|jgi:hypothetical protein|nr:hypothetical protein [Sphaerochaetaceae bacterium]MDD5076923.1 hypothetical protein [Sphaerochaetaceae bacterium]